MSEGMRCGKRFVHDRQDGRSVKQETGSISKVLARRGCRRHGPSQWTRPARAEALAVIVSTGARC